jgi:hypothetical protein
MTLQARSRSAKQEAQSSYIKINDLGNCQISLHFARNLMIFLLHPLSWLTVTKSPRPLVEAATDVATDIQRQKKKDMTTLLTLCQLRITF